MPNGLILKIIYSFFPAAIFDFFYFIILNNLTIGIIISRGSKKVERGKIKRPTKYAILINLEENSYTDLYDINNRIYWLISRCLVIGNSICTYNSDTRVYF